MRSAQSSGRPKSGKSADRQRPAAEPAPGRTGPWPRLNRRPCCAVLNPAAELAPGDGLDHVHAVVAVVEAGNVREILAAGVAEDLLHLAGDLLQRLDAVGRAAGVDDRDRLHTVTAQLFNALTRRGQ